MPLQGSTKEGECKEEGTADSSLLRQLRKRDPPGGTEKPNRQSVHPHQGTQVIGNRK